MDQKRYLVSVGVLHSIIIDHLKELGLHGVSENLKEKIELVMLREKEARSEENGKIHEAVVEFFANCSIFRPGSSTFVQNFHDLIHEMLVSYDLEEDDLDTYRIKLYFVNVHSLENRSSIQKLSSFVRTITANISAGSSSRNPPLAMTLPRKKALVLAHLIFDDDGHSAATANRLHSAAHFVLKHSNFDQQYQDPLDIMDVSFDLYLGHGEENRTEFMAAKLMALNMIRLEDDVLKYYPGRNYDELSDQTLNKIIEERLEKREEDMLSMTYPNGTGLSWNIISACVTVRDYAPNPGNDSNVCCFCMDAFGSGDQIIGSNYCMHEFHFKCMSEWLLNKRLCPHCKNLVLPTHIAYPNWVKDLNMVRSFLTRDYSLED